MSPLPTGTAPWIKVCGITRRADLDACAAAGVTAVGINFYPKSKRSITMAQALDLLPEETSGPAVIALFVNATLSDIAAAAASGRFQALQLHGDESPEYLQEVRKLGLPVLRALALRSASDLVKLERHDADAYILDAWAPGVFGGTGALSDWSLAADSVQRFPEKRIILSGGITPANAAQAMREVQPAGLDLASGVESAPGIKDHAMIQDLMAAVKPGPMVNR